MIHKVSNSVLLTFGCASLCLTVCALVYMVFMWSPIQYHHLYVKNSVDRNWTWPWSPVKFNQRHASGRIQNTNSDLHLTSIIADREHLEIDKSWAVKMTISSAATPSWAEGNDVNVSEKMAPASILNSTSSDQRFTTTSTQKVTINVDFELDLNYTAKRKNWTRSLKGQNWKPAKIIKSPKNLPPSFEYNKERNGTKYLVYLCDHRSNCGGLGDRERSLTGVYVWSRIIQRKFKLVMTSPCNLSNFYVPNRVDWLPKEGELEPPSHNNTVYLYSNLDKGTLSKFKEGDFNENFPQKCIYLRTNSDVYAQFRGHPHYANRVKDWSGLFDKRIRFFWAWNELMKPAAKFATRLETILGPEFIKRKGFFTTRNGNPHKSDKPMYNVGNSSLICAHVRIGKNPSNPKDEAFTAVTGEDIPVLFDFMKKKDKNGDARFFLATDYIYVRNQARKFFGSRYIDFGALISHIDRQRYDKDACMGFESALLDQTILSLCDVLITSRSGFSVKAAHMRNSTDPVYVIDGGEVKVLEE